MQELIDPPGAEVKEFKIKTINPVVNVIALIAAFVIYFIILSYIISGNLRLSGYNQLIFIFILLASGAGAYFTSRALSVSHTSISIQNGNLEILSETKFLGTFKNVSIALEEIRGFEIYINRLGF